VANQGRLSKFSEQRIMSFIGDRTSALDFLLGRTNYERTTSVPYAASHFKLDRMRRLLALVGDPQLGLKVVHVAGTKGKGSTAAMIAASLQAAGYGTGLYTSPHLERLEERFTIDGQQCSAAEFVSLTAELQQAVARLEREATGAANLDANFDANPTFFELTTALAMLHFARRGVDAAVLEVGLGGRLDSTNVCLPSVCVITSISFDHTRQLGNTLAAIAGEKAGIIKAGVPVVSGVVLPEPGDVIEQAAASLQAPLYRRGREFDFEYSPAANRFTYRAPAAAIWPELGDISLGMLGEHQAANGAVAIAALARLCEQGWRIDAEQVREGLASACCPARIEVLGERPTIVCDVAHNVASIAALIRVLEERYPAARRILIFASSMDKDTRGMLRLLLPKFDHVILTRYVNNPRAVALEELAALAGDEAAGLEPSGKIPRWETQPDPTSALARAHELASPDDLLCITGSFFLAAELQPLLAAGKLNRLATPQLA
jgi:dihydrofolate synthase/folylpolyglutamate synthase